MKKKAKRRKLYVFTDKNKQIKTVKPHFKLGAWVAKNWQQVKKRKDGKVPMFRFDPEVFRSFKGEISPKAKIIYLCVSSHEIICGFSEIAKKEAI